MHITWMSWFFFTKINFIWNNAKRVKFVLYNLMVTHFNPCSSNDDTNSIPHDYIRAPNNTDFKQPDLGSCNHLTKTLNNSIYARTSINCGQQLTELWPEIWASVYVATLKPLFIRTSRYNPHSFALLAIKSSDRLD